MAIQAEERRYLPLYEREVLQRHPEHFFIPRSRILRQMLLELSQSETDVEMRAKLGRTIVASLPSRFLERNNGKFIAVTYTRKVLAVCDTLEALNEKLATMNLKENYYVKRIGHEAVAEI